VSLLASSAFDVELFADWSSLHEVTSKLMAIPGISVFNTVFKLLNFINVIFNEKIFTCKESKQDAIAMGRRALK
jgi:hypothetical protein